ncbi:MAG: aldo/keto reductase, partial [Syntrophomonadaceae bacterium]|nr:aldo/keto reductase [Syntrophomonadaceae bacterium]
MEKRKYQNTDNSISLLGFGCMRLPLQSEKYEDIDKKQAQEMIDYAYENGVNYFDTAYPYHNGCSETFIGQALARYPRESFYLATKMPIWLINEPQDVEKIFEEQLRKCQVDYFDFYLLHNLSEERLAIEKRHRIYDHLNEKKRQGQIKYLGFSFHDSPEVLERIINSYEWDFVQIQLNYMDWEMQQ